MVYVFVFLCLFLQACAEEKKPNTSASEPFERKEAAGLRVSYFLYGDTEPIIQVSVKRPDNLIGLPLDPLIDKIGKDRSRYTDKMYFARWEGYFNPQLDGRYGFNMVVSGKAHLRVYRDNETLCEIDLLDTRTPCIPGLSYSDHFGNTATCTSFREWVVGCEGLFFADRAYRFRFEYHPPLRGLYLSKLEWSSEGVSERGFSEKRTDGDPYFTHYK